MVEKENEDIRKNRMTTALHDLYCDWNYSDVSMLYSFTRVEVCYKQPTVICGYSCPNNRWGIDSAGSCRWTTEDYPDFVNISRRSAGEECNRLSVSHWCYVENTSVTFYFLKTFDWPMVQWNLINSRQTERKVELCQFQRLVHYLTKVFELSLDCGFLVLSVDHSVRRSMKNAAKCVN